MAATLEQTVNPAVSTGSITASPVLTKLGSLLLVFIGTSALTDTVSTVTDDAGNTYTKAYGVASGSGGNTELWYSLNSKQTASITVTFSATVTTKSVFVREYSGMSKNATCIDKSASTSGSGTAVSSGATALTTENTELVVCSCSCLGTSPTNSVGAGFGNYTSQVLLAGLSLHSIEDLTTTIRAAQTGLMTAGGTLPVWDVGVATFVIQNALDINNYKFVKVGDGMSTTEKR